MITQPLLMIPCLMPCGSQLRQSVGVADTNAPMSSEPCCDIDRTSLVKSSARLSYCSERTAEGSAYIHRSQHVDSICAHPAGVSHALLWVQKFSFMSGWIWCWNAWQATHQLKTEAVCLIPACALAVGFFVGGR